jgi:sialate O-acetylesterase
MLRHTLLIVCVACTSALADVHRTAPGSFRWHPSLGDSMVLQISPGRAAVFGFGAPPNANCEAQLNGGWQGDKTAAADGSWRLELGVQGASTQGSVLTVSCAGAPYNLTARDVVFGDVYITSGQSNMELPVEHTFSYWNVSLNETRYFEQPNIRVTKVPHNLQLQPATTLGAPLIWSRANWSALKGHSAISYYFAKELSTMLEGGDAAPVGIIESSWGGTIIESWLSLEAQQGCGYRICGPDAPKHKVCNASVMDSHQQPGSLFNGERPPPLPRFVVYAMVRCGQRGKAQLHHLGVVAWRGAQG